MIKKLEEKNNLYNKQNLQKKKLKTKMSIGHIAHLNRSFYDIQA